MLYLPVGAAVVAADVDASVVVVVDEFATMHWPFVHEQFDDNEYRDEQRHVRQEWTHWRFAAFRLYGVRATRAAERLHQPEMKRLHDL